jgi:hypothetical protein
VLGQDTDWRKRKTLTREPQCQREEESASVTVRLGGVLGRGCYLVLGRMVPRGLLPFFWSLLFIFMFSELFHIFC